MMSTKPTRLTIENTVFKTEQTQNHPALETTEGKLALLAWVENQLASGVEISGGDWWGEVEALNLDCHAYDEDLGAELGTIELIFYPLKTGHSTDTQTVVARMTVGFEQMPVFHAQARN